MERAGLRRQVMAFGPCLFFFCRKTGSAAGAFTTHIDDILGCGGPDTLPKIRECPEQRFGELELRESFIVHVGPDITQECDLSVTLTRDKFAQNLKPLPVSAQFWAARQRALSTEDVKLCRRKPGELCWLATDICARSARTASRVNSLQGSDVYRINDLAQTVKARQQAAILKYFHRPI